MTRREVKMHIIYRIKVGLDRYLKCIPSISSIQDEEALLVLIGVPIAFASWSPSGLILLTNNAIGDGKGKLIF